MASYHPLAMSQAVVADAAQAQQQFQQGVQWLRQGKTDKATAVFEQLVLSHPGLVEAHNNLGVLYAAGWVMPVRRWKPVCGPADRW
jgi:lipopolysaccharide biosynthesis regulator YciM